MACLRLPHAALLIGASLVAASPGAAPASADDIPVPGPDSTAAITAAEIGRHLGILASDAFEGRDTGSPGGLAAARYIASVFERAGLEPAGDDGTFLQDVGVLGFDLPRAPRVLAYAGADDDEPFVAEVGREFRYLGGTGSDAPLELVFVRAAEDLPAEPSRDLALVFSGPFGQQFGLLSEAGRGWGALVLSGPAMPGEPAAPSRGVGSPDGGDLRIMARGTLVQRLADGSVTHLRGEVVTAAPTPAVNVVGRIAGTGPHADEVLVLSAHYDHLGRRAARPGEDPATADLIFNGADDDASGTVALLEIAEAIAAGDPPGRTLVFLAATGEEKGLIGTEHYLDHPVEPLARTVCNLNFEMVGRPDAKVGGAGRLWLTGHEFTNLMDLFNAHDVTIEPDLRPEQQFFRRSDNFAFVRRGIVGQTLSSFDVDRDTIYHTEADEPEAMDLEHMEQAVRHALAATRLLADGEITPDWTEAGRAAGFAPANDGAGGDGGDGADGDAGAEATDGATDGAARGGR